MAGLTNDITRTLGLDTNWNDEVPVNPEMVLNFFDGKLEGHSQEDAARIRSIVGQFITKVSTVLLQLLSRTANDAVTKSKEAAAAAAAEEMEERNRKREKARLKRESEAHAELVEIVSSLIVSPVAHGGEAMERLKQSKAEGKKPWRGGLGC